LRASKTEKLSSEFSITSDEPAKHSIPLTRAGHRDATSLPHDPDFPESDAQFRNTDTLAAVIARLYGPGSGAGINQDAPSLRRQRRSRLTASSTEKPMNQRKSRL
jgi:hypothetical protein